jgi:hypothetical protein
MTKKKTYIGEGQKRFFDFLPKEVFESFSDEEKVNYREYRRYQKEVGKGLVRISKHQEEIDKLNRLIQIEYKKIKGDGENGGWEMKVQKFYDKINHIDKNFHLNCSVERRDRSSVSKKINDGELVSFKKDHILKKNYGEKEIGKVYKLYGRVENSVFRQPIYLGDETKVRFVLSKLVDEDLTEETYDVFKDELRVLISQYSRYLIFHNKWEGFKGETHNLDSISNWCKWCEENGVNRYEWGGKR